MSSLSSSSPYPAPPPEELLQVLTENIDQVLLVYDRAGRCLYVNPAYERIWQYSRESLYTDGASWLAAVHPDDLPQVTASLKRQKQGISEAQEYRIIRPDGTCCWVRSQIYVLQDDQGNPTQVLGWAEDYTARKQLELDLQAAQIALQRRISQERLLRSITTRMRSSLDLDQVLATTATDVRSLFEADRVVIYQLCGDGQRRVVQQAFCPPHQAVGADLLLPEALPKVFADRFQQGLPYWVDDVDAVIWPETTADFLHEFQVKSVMVAPIVLHNPDAETRASPWGVLAIHACDTLRQWQADEGEMLQQVADQLAVAIHQAELYAQLQQANQELARLAKTDGLTQLANRRWLDHYLRQEWQRLARQHQLLSVILADVDYFKPYNDTHGHAAGDQALMAIAQVIRSAAKRPADLAARYGGEEFAIVLPNTDTAGALRVVESIQEALQRLALPHQARPGQPLITLSFGIATQVPQPQQRFDQIMQQADHALYATKALGRNGYQIFDGEANPTDP